jgi:site-specific DNA-methyltransferase (adenine-specific)
VTEKAPKNRTITLNNRQIAHYAAQAIKLSAPAQFVDICDKILWQDTFRALNYIPDKCVDLMIVDPPYNMRKVFGANLFKAMGFKEYQKWLDKWLKKTVRILKDNASVYICSDWKTSLAIPQIAGKYFVLQNRISWEREKGRSAANNWKNCLEDIWFFTKSDTYTFNLDAVKVRRNVLAPYRDLSGTPKDWTETDGTKQRLTSPSNIWTDISVPFWSMPENTPHPTQKPEKLIAKLILASSNAGDLVFDPFLGSGTTAVTAKKLERHFLGIEREKEYVAYAMHRLKKAEADKSIQGYEDGAFKLRFGRLG